ncbi:MAG: beta-ketoacyl-ACP synthase II [Armatimonadetes bacterium]|nr:beta-ketoacyl-ACP synthase II [Armatimonadota bacterium]
MRRRVVVTGMGSVSPFGLGLRPLWDAVLEGRSGVGPITSFDVSEYPTRIAAEVTDWDAESLMDPKQAKRSDRYTQFAVVASNMALEDARFSITPDNADRVGVLIGSGIGGMRTWEEQFERLLERGPMKISPFFVPMMIVNMGSGMVSMITGARGPNTTVVTACATSTHALGDAAEIIRRGAADVMVAGGSESTIVRCALAGFCRAGALSRRNDDPKHACRPFDIARDGFVMGEGATVMILEELEAARARGATIYGEIAGYGMSGDAYHMTDPDPEGLGPMRAMRAALADAQVEPRDVGYINAHAPGTLAGDDIEAKAIRLLFGDHADVVPVSSTKPIHGHQLGATGATEFAVCLLAMREGLIPASLNSVNIDPECQVNVVQGEPLKADVSVSMSNSFGFGGHNAVLVGRRVEIRDRPQFSTSKIGACP